MMSCLDMMYRPHPAPTYLSPMQPNITYDTSSLQLYGKMQDSTPGLCQLTGGMEERSKKAHGLTVFGPFSLTASANISSREVGNSQFQFPFHSSFHAPTDSKASNSGSLQKRKMASHQEENKRNTRVTELIEAEDSTSNHRPSCARVDTSNENQQHRTTAECSSTYRKTSSSASQCSCTATSHETKPSPNRNEHRHASSSLSDGKRRKEAAMHYVNSRCVMYDYFEGDISQEVDDHFTRALSQKDKSEDYPSPMNQRNFPASFWNSEYKPPALPLSFAGVPYDVMKGITSPFHPLYGSCASTLSHRPGLSPFETFSASASLPSLPSHLSPTPEQWYAAYPSGLGTNYSTQNCYSQQAAINAAAAAAATDLYGLSSAASHPLDHRYSSLLAQQNSAAIELARMRASGTVASLAASLASPVSDIGKDAMGLWATTRFPAFRF